MYKVILRHALRDPISFACTPGETVMAAARRAGYALAAACEQGGCGACQAVREAGNLTYPLPVSQRRRLGPGGIIFELTCRAVPASDLTLACLQPWRITARMPLSARLGAAAHNPGQTDNS